MRALATQVVRELLRLDRQSRPSRASEWQAALRQVESGDYTRCRLAVVTLRHLTRELQEELGYSRPASTAAGDSAESGNTMLLRLLMDFRQALDSFNDRGEMGDLLILGRGLESYLSAREGMEGKGLFPSLSRAYTVANLL